MKKANLQELQNMGLSVQANSKKDTIIDMVPHYLTKNIAELRIYPTSETEPGDDSGNYLLLTRNKE